MCTHGSHVNVDVKNISIIDSSIEEQNTMRLY